MFRSSLGCIQHPKSGQNTRLSQHYPSRVPLFNCFDKYYDHIVPYIYCAFIFIMLTIFRKKLLSYLRNLINKLSPC